MLRNKKNYLHSLYISDIYLATAGHSIQNKHIHCSTHHTRLYRCSVSHNHVRYHITTGIGIGTRIGIGAGKKYRVSEVSVNPGIGLSLIKAVCCVVRDIEMLTVFLFLSPRNAVQHNAQPP